MRADEVVSANALAALQHHLFDPVSCGVEPGRRCPEPNLDAGLLEQPGNSIAQDLGPVGPGDVSQWSGAFAEVEPGPEPGAADLLTGQVKLEAGESLKKCLPHTGAAVVIHQLGGTSILPAGPIALGERLQHETDEPRLIGEAHRKPEKAARATEIIHLAIEMEQHLNAAPHHLG
jgi:hypothetical protein